MQSDKALNKPVKSFNSSAVKNLADLDSKLNGYRPDLASVAAIKYGKLFKSVLSKKGMKKAASTTPNSRSIRKAKRVA